MIQLSRKIFFCCSLKNKKKYTGLNLTLEVFFHGKTDDKSHLVINFFDIDEFLKKTILQWDHKEFKDISFSNFSENCATKINKNWPFVKVVTLDKVSLFVKEPFKKIDIIF